MCGFAGYIDLNLKVDGHQSIIKNMIDKIAHRGPDDEGIWISEDKQVILGHRRLSILDLSSSGHQPMLSLSKDLIIIFNGEIYNHLSIRKELLENGFSISWKGHSDTETLLEAIAAWGIEKTLNKCVGMFAFVVFDQKKKKLTLARDRFGEKPLYFGWIDGAFVFASELKALQVHPNFHNAISKDSLADYLRFNYVPAPKSIFKEIYKLEPGTFLHKGIDDMHVKDYSPQKYWSLGEVVSNGLDDQIHHEHDALESLEKALSQSIKSQMLSDVPLGAFLSGGVDSSVVVALMQKESMQPVKTFTIGFESSAYDESPFAKEVANHLNTDHTEFFVTSEETRDVISMLPEMYDEPFADSSQIPTYLVSQAAKQKVTVALSGDGGDELFGGYNRYFWGPNIWNKISWLPFQARKILSQAVLAIPTSGWTGIGKAINLIRPGASGILSLGDKAHKLSNRLNNVHNIDDLYLSLVSEWQDPAEIIKGLPVNNKKFALNCFEDTPKNLSTGDSASRMMFWDTLSYLPDDILCKVDRAAMASSLETRVPFLDHRVAELAWRFPLSMKIKGNKSKWMLRSILYKYVPERLIERPKAGFGIPVGEWLRGPLQEWAEELLNSDRLEKDGYFKTDNIREIWHQHLSGSYDWTPKLWSILMFQSWLDNQNQYR
jgi:asparagine synthase (glutamine-hydrolysing)